MSTYSASPPDISDDEPKYSRRETLLTMLSVLLVILLTSLDQTIIGTAIPRVIADLHGFDRYTWVTTAYLLTSTVMVPIYGKLSDIFGRKPLFLFGLIVFMAGSWLSGAAQSMNQLIVFRALQGLGAAALLPVAIALVGDLFTPRERARWQGLMGAVFGLSAIIGPAVGGWLTDNASWRWVFYVNLPLGLISLLALIFLMPNLGGRKEVVSIDYCGAALLVSGAVPLLLGFTWAGSMYPWESPQVIVAFGLAIVALTGFIFYEMKLSRSGGAPIIEPGLFKNRVFSISVLITVISNMAMFSCIFFLPLYMQGVVGTSVTRSGFLLMPLMVTAVIGSIVSGRIVAAMGKYKIVAVVGAAVSTLGASQLLKLGVQSTHTDVVVAMVVLGLGMGTSMSLYNLIVQNALPARIGQATSTLVFFRSIGGTMALAVMGSLMAGAYLPAFHHALPEEIAREVPAAVVSTFDNPQILLSPEARMQMTTQFSAFGDKGLALLAGLITAVKSGLVKGIHLIFILGFVLMVIGLIAVLFLPEIELRGRDRPRDKDAGEQEGEAEEAESVVLAG